VIVLAPRPPDLSLSCRVGGALVVAAFGLRTGDGPTLLMVFPAVRVIALSGWLFGILLGLSVQYASVAMKHF